MPFSAKDLEILNARSSFERSLYDYPAVEGAKYLKDPNRFGGPTSTVTTPSPVKPVVTNAVDAATRLEQGFTGVRSFPSSARPPIPASAANSPLAEALASALKTPSLARIPIPNAIASNAGRVAPLAKSAANALSAGGPVGAAAWLLYGPAKEFRDSLLEKEKNFFNDRVPGLGTGLAQGLKSFDPIFGGEIPPWLNPLNYVSGKPQTKIEPGSKSFEVPIQTTSQGTFQVSYQLSVSIRNSNTGQISNPPPTTGTISLIGQPLTLIYTSEPTQKRLSIKYIDLREGSGNYGKTIVSDLISSVVGDDIQVTSLSGNITGLGAEPQYPTSPSEAPNGPASYAPDFVPVGAIKPFAPTVDPSPSPLPDPTKQPEKYPTIPSQPGTPTPSPNRPKEEKPSIPLIPPLPFIPLIPAKAPSSPSQQPGWKSLTDPTQSPVPNPGTGMSGAKPPNVPPVASPPRCRDKCSQNIQDKVDNLGDQLQKGIPIANAAGQIVDLSLLTTINSKLGEQLPGGIGGKLTRLSEWLHLDRVLNVLTFTSTLHNAYFLSNGLTQTLFSMISNVLAVIGIKDNEGNPLNISNIVGSTVENFAKSVLGVETVDGIKSEWKKYSRIYQAAANIVWSVQSIGQSILSVLEVVGSNVAKIGNALKKFGVIGEKAFGWMNQQPNFQNKFFTLFERAQDVTSQIDGVASNALSAEQTYAQLGQQTDELIKAMKEDDGSKQGKESPEAAKKKQAEAQSKSVSTTTTIPIEAETKPAT